MTRASYLAFAFISCVTFGCDSGGSRPIVSTTDSGDASDGDSSTGTDTMASSDGTTSDSSSGSSESESSTGPVVVTFTDHVEPLFVQDCGIEDCHIGDVPPGAFAATDYDAIVKFIDNIRDAVAGRRMPPTVNEMYTYTPDDAVFLELMDSWEADGFER